VARRLSTASAAPFTLPAFGEWFAATLGEQLAILRRARVLHDYRLLRGPWADPHSVIDSVGDTNVSLAAELPDLDTAIDVDDPPSLLHDTLGLAEEEANALRERFGELHAIERRLARGIAQTVGFLAAGGNHHSLANTADVFDQAYADAST